MSIFYENPSSGSLVVPCKRIDRQTGKETDGSTGRHDEANSYFCKFVFLPKITAEE
jgi:hypothetical protein